MLLFEIGSKPPQDGVRQFRRYNLYRALGRPEPGVLDIIRSRLNRVPAGDIVRREGGTQEPLLRGGDLLADPPELGLVGPKPVQHDSELARDGHEGAAQTSSFGDGHAPGFEGRPSMSPGKDTQRGLIERLADHTVAALADPPASIDLARSVFAWGQAEVGADIA